MPPPSPTGDGLAVGDVVFALFPTHDPAGREQEGRRPAVVVGLPQRLGATRFGVLIVVPMTTDRGQDWARRSPALYPRLAMGAANLHSDSICLLDQARSLDVGRVRRYGGTLSDEEYRPIHASLTRMLAPAEP